MDLFPSACISKVSPILYLDSSLEAGRVEESAYSEIEGNLRALILNVAKEARLLVRAQFIGQRGRRHQWRDASQ